ncbi:glycosyltransferase [Aquabacterium sp.]|uniref:glycosyltransferase n=1 Tax=Aquabacterium sp. TaxID=1872578 RepID=UPI003D0490CE
MLSLARHLRRRGYRVSFLTSQAGPLVHEGYDILRCAGRGGLLRALWQHKRCPILVSSPPGTPAAEVAGTARILGYRVIVDIRDPYVSEALAVGDLKPGLITSVKRWLERSLFMSAHGISYVSVPLKQAMERHFGHPRVPQVIAPNGIDTDIFFFRRNHDRQLLRQQLAFGVEPVFVYAGILGGKALDETFEALAPVLRKGSKLLMIGVLDEHSEPIRKRLQELAKTLGIESQVIWHFNVDLPGVARLLSACDVGINPLPRTRSYCLPVKTFEYLACGLYPLCIASADSALSSLFPEDSIGAVCTGWEEYTSMAITLASQIEMLRSNAANRAEFAKQFDREKANEVLEKTLVQSGSYEA